MTLRSRWSSLPCALLGMLCVSCASYTEPQAADSGVHDATDCKGAFALATPRAPNFGGLNPPASDPPRRRIATETVDVHPGPRSRLKIGVGELVRVTLSPDPGRMVRWSEAQLEGPKGYFDRPWGNPVTFVAPGAGARPVVMATVEGEPPVCVELTVVEPSDVLLERIEPVLHLKALPSAGFRANIYIRPADVSFSHILLSEGVSKAAASGYYSDENNIPHLTVHWTDMQSHEEKKGTYVGWDLVWSGTRTVTPFANGSFTWTIPWFYTVPSSAPAAVTPMYPKPFVTLQHQKRVDSFGTVVISKGVISNGVLRSDAIVVHAALDDVDSGTGYIPR